MSTNNIAITETPTKTWALDWRLCELQDNEARLVVKLRPWDNSTYKFDHSARQELQQRLADSLESYQTGDKFTRLVKLVDGIKAATAEIVEARGMVATAEAQFTQAAATDGEFDADCDVLFLKREIVDKAERLQRLHAAEAELRKQVIVEATEQLTTYRRALEQQARSELQTAIDTVNASLAIVMPLLRRAERGVNAFVTVHGINVATVLPAVPAMPVDLASLQAEPAKAAT